MAELDLDPRCTASKLPPPAPRLLLCPSFLISHECLSVHMIIWPLLSQPGTPFCFHELPFNTRGFWGWWLWLPFLVLEGQHCPGCRFLSVLKLHICDIDPEAPVGASVQVSSEVPFSPAFQHQTCFLWLSTDGLYPGEGMLWSWPCPLGGIPTRPPLASRFVPCQLYEALPGNAGSGGFPPGPYIELLSCLF